ncbi:MAG: HAD-IA family hydrolase [Kiloniellaceae bacterium]
MPEPDSIDNQEGQLVEAVVFDVGGVLLDWDPRHLYRKLFADGDAMEHFLGEVCTQAWNEQADAGRPTAEITAELCRDHPERRELIESYYARFDEMIAGALEDSVAIVERLHGQGMPLYVLSNFSAETFPLAQRRFEFFERFSGLVISGSEAMKKPDRRIFDLVIDRFTLTPAQTLFVDDRADNVLAAREAGWQALDFTSAERLERDLQALGLLEPSPATA